jgi:hypothetical protein
MLTLPSLAKAEAIVVRQGDLLGRRNGMTSIRLQLEGDCPSIAACSGDCDRRTSWLMKSKSHSSKMRCCDSSLPCGTLKFSDASKRRMAFSIFRAATPHGSSLRLRYSRELRNGLKEFTITFPVIMRSSSFRALHFKNSSWTPFHSVLSNGVTAFRVLDHGIISQKFAVSKGRETVSFALLALRRPSTLVSQILELVLPSFDEAIAA